MLFRETVLILSREILVFFREIVSYVT